MAKHGANFGPYTFTPSFQPEGLAGTRASRWQVNNTHGDPEEDGRALPTSRIPSRAPAKGRRVVHDDDPRRGASTWVTSVNREGPSRIGQSPRVSCRRRAIRAARFRTGRLRSRAHDPGQRSAFSAISLVKAPAVRRASPTSSSFFLQLHPARMAERSREETKMKMKKKMKEGRRVSSTHRRALVAAHSNPCFISPSLAAGSAGNCTPGRETPGVRLLIDGGLSTRAGWVARLQNVRGSIRWRSDGILLTHEHSDHSWPAGSTFWCRQFATPVYCNRLTAEVLQAAAARAAQGLALFYQRRGIFKSRDVTVQTFPGAARCRRGRAGLRVATTAMRHSAFSPTLGFADQAGL